MPGSEYIHTMVATLGGQPQIITFTLDLLLRDFPISEVYVVHPKPTDPRLQHSLDCLRAEFINDHYQGSGQTVACRFDSRVLQLNSIPQEDITDEASANGTQDTIYHLIRELKQEPQRIVHLSVTGGRRIMSLLAISAAQINFKHMDHIWHIYTPREFRQLANEGAIMHASPADDVRLLKVPFVPWGAYFPHLPQPREISAQAMLEHQVAQMDTQMDAAEQARCAQVIGNLTRRQRDVLYVFSQGHTRKDVAGELGISVGAVDTHKTVIFEHCRIAWELSPDEPRDHTFLKEHFAPYFDRHKYTPQPSRKQRKGGS